MRAGVRSPCPVILRLIIFRGTMRAPASQALTHPLRHSRGDRPMAVAATTMRHRSRGRVMSEGLGRCACGDPEGHGAGGFHSTC